MPRPARRAVLAAGLGALATGTAACSDGSEAPGVGPDHGPDLGPDVEVRTGTLRSTHLPGRDLPWVLAMPRDADRSRPPVVVLHGKSGHGEQALTLLGLGEHVAATGLAVAAVDGGNGYWHDREDFLAHDVFADDRLATLTSIPVRLDCGRDDPFASANRAFGKALPGAELTVDAGGHTGEYWRGHGGPQLRWIRARVDEAARS